MDLNVFYICTKLKISILLPPANEVCEGYVFTGAYLSMGGVSAPLHAGIHPLGPEADTPWARHPRADTPPVQCMLGYGQQADGTHPTGMHSCFLRHYVYFNKTTKIFTTQNYCLTKLLLYERH